MVKNEKQSLGEFFREARKEKGISIDEIVRDTNIPKKYLEAIEADNFDVFPGETYAIGFITNYAEALEVDRDLAISFYKRQIRIEQDSPIEELLGKKKQPAFENNRLVIGASVAGIMIIVFLLVLFTRKSDNTGALSPKAYYFSLDDTGKIVKQKFKLNDSVVLTNSERSISIELVKVEPSRSLDFKIGSKDYSIKSGELLSVDSDNNGTNDLGIELLSARPRDIRLAITFLRENLEAIGESNKSEFLNKYSEYILSESEFLTAPNKGPVSMKIVSQGKGFLSYVTDEKEEKQFYMNDGSVYNISFLSNLVLYLGNSGAVKIIIGNREEVGGGWGEVGKSIFYWKSKNGQFSLVRAILK